MRFHTKFFIDLSIFADNVSLLRKIAPNNEILFMVKANAYGHGMVELVRYAVSELGIKEFGCATIAEAKKLRLELSDYQFEIFVFSDLQLESEQSLEIYLNLRVIPILNHLSDLRFFLNHPGFRYFPLCLKFNTGMNRLGISTTDQEEVINLLKKNKRSEIFHLFSHFSSSFLPVNQMRTQKQYDTFKKVKEIFKSEKIEVLHSSMANSGAIEQRFALEETHIRPGLILYGPSSLLKGESCWTGRNIARLETNVIHTFKVSKGLPVGYGGTPTTSDGTIVLLALGYGDGINSSYRGVTLPCNKLMPQVFGRVNMDMIQVFFPKECNVKTGDEFLIWDHDPETLLSLSQQMKMIPYELFCQLTVRIPRVYSL